MDDLLPYIIARKGDRIYIDANVLVYYFYSKYRPYFYQKANDFLLKVQGGKFEGVISCITIMEFIKSLRELFVEYGKIGSMQEVENLVQQFVRDVFSIAHLKFVGGCPADMGPTFRTEELYKAVSSKALQIMQKYPGKIGTSAEAGEPEHEGIHTADAFHVILAKRLQCNKLATFAWEFKQTASEITPLILIDHDTFW